MTVLLRLAVLTGAWTAFDVLLLAVYSAVARLRRPRVVVDHGPLLAVDAVLWSYAETVGGVP